MTGECGRLYAGTSGFSYPGWIPRFYAPGRSSRDLLPVYAARLPAVELHSTFYRRPAPATVGRWLEQTPADFRFCPKAQRGSTRRAWSRDDAGDRFAWLSGAVRAFGDRLGCVLMSAPGSLERDDDALRRVLLAWPADLPLALELPHPSWADDSVYAALDGAGVALVATDRDERAEPDLRRIGRLIYLRLRRARYERPAVERWARRLEPFLADGLDAFVFFRHDEDGSMALQAEALLGQIRAITCP